MNRFTKAVALAATIALMTPSAPASAYASDIIVQAATTIDDPDVNAILGVSERARLEYFLPNGGAGAIGYYSPDGWTNGNEAFQIHDLAADGQRVGVHWRLTDGTKRGICVYTDGKYASSYGGVCVPPVPEGKKIEFRVGRCDLDTTGCNELSDWSWTNGTSLPSYVDGWVDYKDDADTSINGECYDDRYTDC